MLAGKIALIVDDDAACRGLIEIALKNLHPTVEIAGDLQEAFHRTRQCSPAIITLDLGIPKYSTTGQMATMEEIEDYIRTFANEHTIIIVTGSVDESLIARMMDAGACDYLTKDMISNRLGFEERVMRAGTLHNSILIKESTARIEKDVVMLQAQLRMSFGHAKREALKASEFYEKHIAQVKKETYARATKDRDTYWNKRIFALANVTGWLFVFLWKLVWEKISGKR